MNLFCRSIARKLVWVTLPLVMAFSAVLHAEDTLADHWMVTPKAGEQKTFEEALKKHLNYRQGKGDPRQWKVYVQVLGENLNTYIIRSCCFKWAEMDQYRQWGQDNRTTDHWNDHVKPLVAHASHNFSRLDMVNSHWPEDDSEYQYFGVSQMKVKAGHAASTRSDLATISDHAKEMKWPYFWSWSWQEAGDNTLSLVTPFPNYAAMESPQTSFFEALKQHLSSESRAQKLIESWSSHFSDSRYDLYRLRTDLSMTKP
ncbi:hypothetical protein [Ferrimonas gelatinilytica]|uniref:Secreted protein n=1 Tax=Ferrimonas gelatinilytica TaxID=1255257 RepID=A0ABP9RYF7_9GAMM